MIAAVDFVPDDAVFHFGSQTFRENKVIDPPADIVCPGVKHVTPPSVLDFVWVKIAERIDKAAFHQFLELGSFLYRVPGVSFVRLGVSDIDRVVGDVEVAAGDNRLLLVETLQIIPEVLVKFHSV